jgi:hypothetical protein
LKHYSAGLKKNRYEAEGAGTGLLSYPVLAGQCVSAALWAGAWALINSCLYLGNRCPTHSLWRLKQSPLHSSGQDQEVPHLSWPSMASLEPRLPPAPALIWAMFTLILSFKANASLSGVQAA